MVAVLADLVIDDDWVGRLWIVQLKASPGRVLTGALPSAADPGVMRVDCGRCIACGPCVKARPGRLVRKHQRVGGHPAGAGCSGPARTDAAVRAA